jgi:ubiquinone/menaquinone biosynthesis C-methylase UbiE
MKSWHVQILCFLTIVVFSYLVKKSQQISLLKLHNISSDVRFSQGNILALNVEENTYDFIWACESTEHVIREDLDLMFREFRRVAKPAARAFASKICFCSFVIRTDVL